MALIFVVIVVMLLILIAWTWNSLGIIEKKNKVLYIIFGIGAIYFLTFIIFHISKSGINYENKEAMKLIQNVFVMLFSIINGYIVLPYIFKQIEQIQNNEIEREQLIKGMVILVIIMIIVSIFEISYLKNIQNGILTMTKK